MGTQEKAHWYSKWTRLCGRVKDWNQISPPAGTPGGASSHTQRGLCVRRTQKADVVLVACVLRAHNYERRRGFELCSIRPCIRRCFLHLAEVLVGALRRTVSYDRSHQNIRTRFLRQNIVLERPAAAGHIFRLKAHSSMNIQLSEQYEYDVRFYFRFFFFFLLTWMD